MGTRSLTVFKDGNSKEEIAVMYRQYDGYLDGHGKELAEFLDGIEIVNGLGMDEKKVANGAACLAAQIVADFKNEPGSIYLYPAKTRDCGEEYIYTVTAEVGKPIQIKVGGYGETEFIGTPADLLSKVEESAVTA